MTINKVQGQTLDFDGLYLPEPLFSLVRLHAALSRAKTRGNIKVLIKLANKNKLHTCCPKNIVYHEILNLIHTN